MRVIYDISVLAQARRYPQARTGIFRVADNVARALVASGESDLHLSFCVAEGIEQPVGFLAGDPRLRGVGLSIAPRLRFKLGLYDRIDSLSDRLAAARSPLQTVPVKGLRKFLYHLSQSVPVSPRVLSAGDLARADIYHSPFHPIPGQARAATRVKKFLTVCDVIPVLYPQLFEPDVKSLFGEILDSLGRGDFALCISQSTKDDLCNYRRDLDPARVFVTHLAASELFHPSREPERLAEVRAKYKIPDGVPYLLGLSTLEPRKNIEQAVRCFARLVREQSVGDLRLVLVGTKGWDYDRIFETIASFDIPRDYIITTGYVADEDLAPLYSGALAFVYLSLYEGFGLPPLEAMQCGTPVVVSNTSSLPEVVGDAGRAVDPADEDAVCQAVLDLHRDASLRAEMSRRSLERARQFSWEKCARQTIAAYRSALGA
jgi:glycosyltransferase involved in cell wall biosynthesis